MGLEGYTHFIVYASILIKPDSSVHVQVGQHKSITIRTGNYRKIDAPFDLPSLSTLQFALTLSPLAVDEAHRLLSQHSGLLSLRSLRVFLSICSTLGLRLCVSCHGI